MTHCSFERSVQFLWKSVPALAVVALHLAVSKLNVIQGVGKSAHVFKLSFPACFAIVFQDFHGCGKKKKHTQAHTHTPV